MTAALALLCSAAVGVIEARWLGRSVRAPSVLGAPLRLLLVAAVLLATALLGELAVGAIGWAMGFVVAAAFVHRRLG
jgi:hypothetical protein